MFPLGDLERIPLHRKHVDQYLPQSLPLLGAGGFVEGYLRPIHLALRKVAAQVPIQPELGPGQIDTSVVPLIHLVRVIELAEVFGLSILMMNGGMGVEVTDAEVRTTARLDRSRVDRPLRSRWSGMTRTDCEQSNHYKHSHSLHRSPPWMREGMLRSRRDGKEETASGMPTLSQYFVIPSAVGARGVPPFAFSKGGQVEELAFAYLPT